MKTNVAAKAEKIVTHEGGRAERIKPLLQLRRSVMSCLLWEDSFYEDGKSIADRIAELVGQVTPQEAQAVAVEAREQMKLRHVPLLIAREMARLPTHKGLVAKTLEQIVQRPDELAEFLSIYWLEGRQPLSAQVKRGLAKAYGKFGPYALAKYNRDAAVKLKDVAFLTHAQPKADEAVGEYETASAVIRANYQRGVTLRHRDSSLTRLIDDRLPTPDTWETELSAGKDKRETFERLIAEKKLGALALLRNLRNLEAAGVPRGVVAQALLDAKTERVLPFRFIAAARAVPVWEDLIEPAMLRCLEGLPKLPGRTGLLVDVSGSMDSPISRKSDLRRLDAACGLAILARELCEQVLIVSFSSTLVQVAPRRGFALRDAILASQPRGATYLGAAVAKLNEVALDRLIVITDEQAHDDVPPPKAPRAYVLNVAAEKNGVGYGPWTHVDGWSEAVFAYLRAHEELGEAA